MKDTMSPEETAAWVAAQKAPTNSHESSHKLPPRKYRKPAEWQNMTINGRGGRRRSQRATEPSGDHPHHWILETPNGSQSRGVCKTCGAERDNFENTYIADRAPRWDSTFALTDRSTVRK